MNWFDTPLPRINVLVLAVLVALSSLSVAARRGGDGNIPAGDALRVNVTPDGVQWEVLREVQGATLLVAGPEGRLFQEWFAKGVAPWFGVNDAAALPDGRYLWEVRLMPEVSASVREELRQIAEDDQLESADKLKRTDELNRVYRLRHRELLQSGQFFIQEGRVVAESDAAPTPDLPGQPMTATNPTTRGPLAGYDVSGSWSMTGSLGVGTDFPTQPVDIVNPNPAIRMHDSDGANFSWHLYGTNAGFDIRANSTSTTKRVLFVDPSAPTPSLWVNQSGMWGNGTAFPSAPLTILRSDGTARVLVQEQSAVTASRSLFELQNNGGTFFSLRNTNAAATWSFSVSNTGNFQIDNPALGGAAEMVFFSNGSVRMGPGGVQRFLLDPSGNLTISGNLTANGVFYAADRGLKENIEPLDTKLLLDGLAALPITSWNYKADPAATRHVGPMAQDFQAVFSVGSDGTRINALDASGVTLAAVQALYEQLRRQGEEVERQKQEIAALRARLERLEQR